METHTQFINYIIPTSILIHIEKVHHYNPITFGNEPPQRFLWWWKLQPSFILSGYIDHNNQLRCATLIIHPRFGDWVKPRSNHLTLVSVCAEAYYIPSLEQPVDKAHQYVGSCFIAISVWRKSPIDIYKNCMFTLKRIFNEYVVSGYYSTIALDDILQWVV